MGLEDINIEISTFLTYIIAYFEGLYTLIILHLMNFLLNVNARVNGICKLLIVVCKAH